MSALPGVRCRKWVRLPPLPPYHLFYSIISVSSGVMGYDCQDKPRVSESVSGDYDTGKMERFESDLRED